MELDELNAADRAIVRVALTNHAEELAKQAKKLVPLGHVEMAEKLDLEAGAIFDRIRPMFEEQRRFPLDEPLLDAAREFRDSIPEGGSVTFSSPGHEPVTLTK